MLDLQRKVLSMETRKVASTQASPRLLKSAEIVAMDNEMVDTIIRNIMLQVGRMVQTKIEGTADRLLPMKRICPPLAVDKKATQ